MLCGGVVAGSMFSGWACWGVYVRLVGRMFSPGEELGRMFCPGEELGRMSRGCDCGGWGARVVGSVLGVTVDVWVMGRRWGAYIELGRRRRSICWVGEEVGSVD